MLTVKVLHSENKSPHETFKSSGIANFDEMCKMIITKRLQPVCHTNIN